MKSRRLLITLPVVAITLLPVFPPGNIELSDPVDINDRRISTDITSGELEYILAQVRTKTWGGFYKWALGITEHYPITSITAMALYARDLGTGFSLTPDQTTDVVVYTSRPESEAGNIGRLFFFNRKDGILTLRSEATLLNHNPYHQAAPK